MREAKARGRRKRALWTLLVSSLLALALAEGYCRMRFGAPLHERTPLLEVRANPRRGWEMLPGGEHYTYEHLVHVNALGLRGPEVGEKRAGEQRVLCLGDSLVYGQGVGDDETLPALLERELRADGADWRAVNGGLRAYDTEQELALLEELAPKVRPDAVVLLWFANDVEEFDLAAMAANLERSGPVVFDVHARWEGSVVWSWHLKQILRSSALALKLHHLWSDRHVPAPAADELERAYEHLDAYFARFLELGRAQNFRFYVAAIPVNRALLGEPAGEERVQRMRTIASRRGIEVFDLAPSLRAWVGEHGRLPILPYDGHYDREGNGVMARALAPLVRGTR